MYEKVGCTKPFELKLRFRVFRKKTIFSGIKYWGWDPVGGKDFHLFFFLYNFPVYFQAQGSRLFVGTPPWSHGLESVSSFNWIQVGMYLNSKPWFNYTGSHRVIFLIKFKIESIRFNYKVYFYDVLRNCCAFSFIWKFERYRMAEREDKMWLWAESRLLLKVGHGSCWVGAEIYAGLICHPISRHYFFLSFCWIKWRLSSSWKSWAINKTN